MKKYEQFLVFALLKKSNWLEEAVSPEWTHLYPLMNDIFHFFDSIKQLRNLK